MVSPAPAPEPEKKPKAVHYLRREDGTKEPVPVDPTEGAPVKIRPRRRRQQ